MFGYVMAHLPELSKKQRKRYSSVYCGICRQIRSRASGGARLTLRYDMALQFDEDKAEKREVKKGVETFNIYMELGVTKKKSFLTGWRKDTPDSKPRIVTAFRKEKRNAE